MTQDSVPLHLDDATRLHAAGDLDAARTLYKKVLSTAPGDPRALRGLGLIAIDENVPDRALPFLAACLGANPDDTLARVSLGLALFKLNRLADAAGQFLEAANRAPHLAEPRIHLARTLGRMKRYAQAADILDETAHHFPDRADVWVAKGQTERLQGKPRQAEQSLRRALARKPHDRHILNDLGVVIRAQGRTAEAVGFYREALAAAADDPLTHGNLGNALTELGEMEAAERHLREAVALSPGTVDHRCNLAIFLTRQERPHEAVVLFRDVLMRAPTHVDAWTNFGVAQLDMGDTEGAEASLRRALALRPNNAEARYNLAWVLLLTGRWREGWKAYEWRWRMTHFSSKRRAFAAPAWEGQTVDGTVLLHAEQGLGDTIQFARYAALAKVRCRHLVLEVPRPLVGLIRTLAGVDTIVATGDPLPAFDAHAPLMSLPRLFGTTVDSVPATVPYLTAPNPIPAALRLPASGRRRIGLVWAGSPDNKIDKRRSMAAELFAPLMDDKSVDFVSLQVGPRAVEIAQLPADRVIFDCQNRVANFAETAAIISQLDLVIGVDTAALHLAGALGVPVWALIPFMPDYRWLLGRNDTPWYPHMRLFRQEKPGDWAEVMLRVRAALTLSQPS